VVGMAWDKHFDSHDIYLLAEFESYDTRELVRQCGALDARYKPAVWIGDNRNQAADRFIAELERELATQRERPSRAFCVSPTIMLEMKELYPYVLPQLKALLDTAHRMLFLKDSKTIGYLAAVEQNEIGELAFGAYPAIEALAFAVIELRERREEPKDTDDDSTLADSYAVRETLTKG